MSDDFVDEDLSAIPVGTTVENREGVKAVVTSHESDGTRLRLEYKGIPGLGEEKKEITSSGWRRTTQSVPRVPPAVLAGRRVVAAFEATRFTIALDGGGRVTLSMVDAQAFVEAIAELDRIVGRDDRQ